MNDFDHSDKLDIALRYLKETYGEEGLRYRSVLDLCCGAGDSLPEFSALFSSVTCLEPDPERCDEAMESILDRDLENATALCMDLEEYIREFPNQTFDIVMSGVLQDGEQDEAYGFLKTLKQVIGPDTVCLFAMPFAEGRGMYSRPWTERFLTSCGLDTKLFSACPAEDGQSSSDALYICEPIEGTLLRASCGPETASGKVCFMRSYYVNNGAGMNTAGFRNLQMEEAEDTVGIGAAFEIAEKHFFGDRLPFPAQRHYRRTEVRSPLVRISDSHLVVSLFPETGVAQVSVCLTLEDAPCDNFIYLQQIQNERDDLFTIGGEPGSIPQLCEDVLKDCGLRNSIQGPASVITELNRFGSCEDPLMLSEDDECCLYGILTGDEGYLHVPQSLIEKHMAESWTGRDFVRAFASGSSYVLLNFNRGETYADYIEVQIPYAERYFGEADEYLTLDAATAGVDHGLYFSVEKTQVMQTIAQRLAGASPSPDELKQVIRELEQAGKAEPGTPDEFVFRNADVSCAAENMRGRLELANSELALKYRKSTNRMVIVLTVLALLFVLLRVTGIF